MGNAQKTGKAMGSMDLRLPRQFGGCFSARRIFPIWEPA